MFKKRIIIPLLVLQSILVLSLLLSLILLSIISAGPHLIIYWICFSVALAILGTADFFLLFYKNDQPIIFRLLMPLLNAVAVFSAWIPFTLPYILGGYAPNDGYAYAQLISSLVSVGSSFLLLFLNCPLINVLLHKDDNNNVYKTIYPAIRIALLIFYLLITISVVASASISLIAKQGIYLFNNYDSFYYFVLITVTLWHYSFIFLTIDKGHIFLKKTLFYICQILPLLLALLSRMIIFNHYIPNWENNALYIPYGWNLVSLGIIAACYLTIVLFYLLYKLIKNSYLINEKSKKE